MSFPHHQMGNVTILRVDHDSSTWPTWPSVASTRVPRCTASSPAGICLCSTGTCTVISGQHRADSNMLLFRTFHYRPETRIGHFFFDKCRFNKPAHLLQLCLAAVQSDRIDYGFGHIFNRHNILCVGHILFHDQMCYFVGHRFISTYTERPHSPLVHST